MFGTYTTGSLQRELASTVFARCSYAKVSIELACGLICFCVDQIPALWVYCFMQNVHRTCMILDVYAPRFPHSGVDCAELEQQHTCSRDTLMCVRYAGLHAL